MEHYIAKFSDFVMKNIKHFISFKIQIQQRTIVTVSWNKMVKPVIK